VTRRPRLVVIIALLLLIPSFIGSAATRINYDILTYLPPELDSSKGESILEEPFQMAATTMLIVDDMPPAYTDRLQREVEDVPGVSSAIWVSSIIGAQVPEEMLPQDIRDKFYSGDSTMMIIQYDKPGGSEDTMEAIRRVRALCNGNCYLAGASAIIKDTKDLVSSELPRFVSLAVLLALAAMMLTMESWLLPVILLGTIGLAIIYNAGTNIFLGQISYITQAISAVLQLGVTMDYSIFLFHRYQEERANYADKRDAMAVAVEAAFSSLFGSSLTTIAGFAALCFMRLLLGRDIGIVMAKGVLIGVLTVVFILPSMLLVFDKPIQAHRHKALNPDFSKINAHIVRHRVLYLVIFAVLSIPAIYGEKNTAVYYNLDRSLPQDMPSIVATNKLKDDYNMLTTHFIILKNDVSHQDMEAMTDSIKALDGITGTYSYDELVGSAVPDFFVPDDVKDIFKADDKQLMMVNSSYKVASDASAKQLKELSAIVKKYDQNAYITGEAALTNDLISVSAVDFTVTGYLSVAAIFVIIAIVFKSFTVPIALILSIELAIFINESVPYFIGQTIPFIAPTVINCVQLGATVDYAILMTTRFREELQKGKDRKTAICDAANSADMSIISSALVFFCATLGVSVVSTIEIIGAICKMLARGSLISAVISIFILPAILVVMEPVFAKTSLWWRRARPARAMKRPGAFSKEAASRRMAAAAADDETGLDDADRQTTDKPKGEQL